MARKTARKPVGESASPDGVKVTIRLAGLLKRKLGIVAEMSGKTRAALVAEALEVYLDAAITRMPSIKLNRPGERTEATDPGA